MEKLTLDKKLKFFGYQTAEPYFRGNKNYWDCVNLLRENISLSHPSFENNLSKMPIRLNKLKKNVKNKSDILLKNVDLTVKYMSTRNFDRNIHLDYEELDKLAKRISVFEIPTKYENRSCYRCITFDIKKTPILFNEIWLNSFHSHNNYALEKDYIHELGHTLINRFASSTYNYLHGEFIPISMELLYSYLNMGENGLNMAVTSRLNSTCRKNMFTYVSREEKIGKYTYILSTLLSFQLLEKYMDFSSCEKKYMHNELTNCLNGYITVEEFMNVFNLDFSSRESVKSLNKTLSRKISN